MPSYLEQRDDYWIAEEHDGQGNALIIKTAWTNRYMDLMSKYKIKTIRLNDRLGWLDSDVSFLLDIPELDGVDIISDQVRDISPLFQLRKLKATSLYCKNAKTAGDFAELPHLKSLGLHWRPVFDSVFSQDNIVTVHIESFPNKDLMRWRRNEQLRNLMLRSNSLESLTGVNRFPNIRHLGLYYCPQLTTLNAIKCATHLESLEMYKCRMVRDLTSISHLHGLKKLEIEDCGQIDSLKPLGKCERLEYLKISGNTTIQDGDLSCLVALPHLNRVFLTNRKHYSHTADELEKNELERANHSTRDAKENKR